MGTRARDEHKAALYPGRICGGTHRVRFTRFPLGFEGGDVDVPEQLPVPVQNAGRG